MGRGVIIEPAEQKRGITRKWMRKMRKREKRDH